MAFWSVFPSSLKLRSDWRLLYVEDSEKRSKAYELAAKARKALPEDPELAATLARISYYRKEYSYAVQLMRESAAKRLLNATDLYYLGMAHFELKQIEESEDALRRPLDMGLQEPMVTEGSRVLGELPQHGS